MYIASYRPVPELRINITDQVVSRVGEIITQAMSTFSSSHNREQAYRNLISLNLSLICYGKLFFDLFFLGMLTV
jgi:hypothetical protein